MPPMLTLLLLGCGGWFDQEPACNLDVYDWSDDLLSHVLQGKGDGVFDYNPSDLPRIRVWGSYKPSSGSYSYQVNYSTEFYLDSADYNGFGTVYHNGDLDLLEVERVVDMLGDEFAQYNRVERQGCNVTMISWDIEDTSAENAFTRTGTYTDDATFAWTAEDEDYAYSGTLHADLTRTTRTEAIEDGGFEETTYRSDGTGTELYEQIPCAGSGQTCTGTTELRYNGARHMVYTIYDGEDIYAEVSGDIAYDGAGELNAVFHDGDDTLACTFTYASDGDCVYECEDGDSGDCS